MDPEFPPFFDRTPLYEFLRTEGANDWAEQLRSATEAAFRPEKHGKLIDWIAALTRLPKNPPDLRFDAAGDFVTAEGSLSNLESAELEASLRQFHPWRKGPFRLFGLPIDTEWRSHLKWNRLAPHLDLRNRTVLDVGCGNGYYGWKMIHAGARLVLGIDPSLLFLCQFEAVRKYAPSGTPHFLLPLTDAELGKPPALFDVVFSMGVLYHRTSPIDHLQTLARLIRPGGQLVLESIVLDSPFADVLVPEDRYAKMRNVWFIPSVPMIIRWLKRTGFSDIELVDQSPTTVAEQRKTDWMTFESLSDFLDPQDHRRTIEGYPAPARAILLARHA